MALPAVAPALARESSPFRPLLIWLGPLFALTNLSIIPCFEFHFSISFGNAFNKSGQPIPGSEYVEYVGFWLGIAVFLVPAQAMLVTLCLTWSSGSLWIRLLKHWLTVLASVGCFCVGLLVAPWFMACLRNDDLAKFSSPFQLDEATGRELWEGLGLASAIPMLAIGLQLPFWTMRLATGWRLERLSSQGESTPQTSLAYDALSIRDLLLGTAIVAVSLCSLQFGDRILSEDFTDTFLVSSFIFAGILAPVALLVAIPLAPLFLRKLRLRIAWGVTLLCTVLILVVLLGLAQWFGLMDSDWRTSASGCLVAYVYVIAYTAGLTVLRLDGWRLERSKRP